jgi:hypothetical protein
MIADCIHDVFGAVDNVENTVFCEKKKNVLKRMWSDIDERRVRQLHLKQKSENRDSTTQNQQLLRIVKKI